MCKNTVQYIFSTVMFLVTMTGLAAQVDVKAVVADRESLETLAYCHIVVNNSSTGTITNDDGYFEIRDLANSDTLWVSYIGYEVLAISVREVRGLDTLFLKALSVGIDELTVYSDDGFLYEAIAQCSKVMEGQEAFDSRVYFFLETVDGGRPLEMLEGYYNSTTRGASILTFELKNGRVGWPLQHQGRYYVNLNTTKALAMLDLLEPSDRFPLNPLQYKPSKMKKRFRLIRLPSLSDESILHIAFEPLSDAGTYFEGEMWIDRVSYRLLKLDLAIDNAVSHPFEPYNDRSKISGIDFDISYNFVDSPEGFHIDNMNFSYDIHMIHDWAGVNEPFSVSSGGLLYFYAFNDPFMLPLFDYDPEHNDYRKISFIPYDSVFWARNQRFTPSESQRLKLKFLEQDGVLLNFKTDFRRAEGEELVGFFEQSNIEWKADKRISFKMVNEDEKEVEAPEDEFEVPAFNSDKFRIRIKLFLDANQYNTQWEYTSAAVIDVFESRNRFAENDRIDCIANICLDLGEIARRNLLEELGSIGNVTQDVIAQEYALARKALEKEMEAFLRESQLGVNREALVKWNALVKAKLGIDNIELFQLDKE